METRSGEEHSPGTRRRIQGLERFLIFPPEIEEEEGDEGKSVDRREGEGRLEGAGAVKNIMKPRLLTKPNMIKCSCILSQIVTTAG